ncbi:MAG: ABC transporter related protein [Candidatus Nomurabacteria bacterium GW2011_GWB1_43_7]|uniref:ABC transporter related protein n=1 Tax=Candidatus Nomurabacteria bacterium GW2011_GWB1_43_7 TaxID=1618747 RepID=A0A0G1F8X9_9BACT|nr:MAG: ABC transporter related protein [Candidatus Nomurabacteria bacterium GW2011_GWB1_43_7]
MIAFTKVSKSFDNGGKNFVKALNEISFEIKRKEILCVVGPSGCGKSTIINLLAGFIVPDSGSITVSGKEVAGPSYLRTVVFQDDALFPWKTVKDNIGFGLRCKGLGSNEQAKKIRDILSITNLGEFSDCYPAQLSGGMKQMCALGRALAIEPEIILMDEPFASLDQQTRDLIQEEFLKIKDQIAQTVLLVTHNIDEAIFLGDKILVLTARPAQIKEIITVPFEKPRSPDIRSSQEFIDIKSRIWYMLRNDISVENLV